MNDLNGTTADMGQEESSDSESEYDDDTMAIIHAKNEIEEKRRFFHQIQQIQQENPVPFKRKKELPKEFQAPTVKELLPSYYFDKKSLKLLGKTWNGNLDYLSDSDESEVETDDSRFDYSDYSDYDSDDDDDESDEFTDSLESDSMFSDSDDDLEYHHISQHHHHQQQHHHTPSKNSKRQPVNSNSSSGSKRNPPSKQHPSKGSKSTPTKSNINTQTTPTSPPLKPPTRSKSAPVQN
ncbi:expressed protein, partial [Dictyostelium purpureum]